MRNSKGFTLIEIMIVIVIIGITVGFALISFGDFGESRRILFAAEQLMHTMRLAQQQAILESSTLGLRIDNSGYQFLQLQNNASWAPLSNRGVFRATYFPPNTFITLKTTTKSYTGMPPIIINASGDITPFSLTFNSKSESQMASLTGKQNGDLKFNTTGASK